MFRTLIILYRYLRNPYIIGNVLQFPLIGNVEFFLNKYSIPIPITKTTHYTINFIRYLLINLVCY